MLLDQVGPEAVVARGHRCMCGECDHAGDTRHCLLETNALFAHATRDGLKDGKATMSFIQMQHTGNDAELGESAEASHAKKQLLADAHSAVSTIEAGSQLTIFRGVAFDIGVK